MRTMRVALLVVMVALATLFTTVGPAAAATGVCPAGTCLPGAIDTCTYATSQPLFKGNATIVHPGCQPVRWGGGYERMTAWRWTSTGWQATSVTEGGTWYAWPFASGWTWVWSSATGWLAIQSDRVLLRRQFNTCPSLCSEWWL